MGKEISGGAIPAPEKKAYEKPALVEYGSIAKLTQSGTSSSSDAAMSMAPCL